MSTLLRIVILVAGGWMAFIGGWAVAIHRSKSTPELQQINLWTGLTLFAGGVGLLATGLLRSTDEPG